MDGREPMDINKMHLEALLLILEINKLHLKAANAFQQEYPEKKIYQAIYQYYLKEKETEQISPNDTNKLYQWAKEKARYSLLESLIRIQINRLMYPQILEGIYFNVVDHFILNNLDFLIQILLESAKTWIPNKSFHMIPITEISKDKLNDLVSQLLIEIDPSLNWLDLFQQAYRQNKIIFIDELTEKEKEKIDKELLARGNLCLIKEEGPYILFHYTGTIEDVPALLHELIHFIVYYKNPKQQVSRTLAEFPSLFYEFYALSFLEKKGYPKKEIHFLENNRMENIISITPYVFNTCQYMSMFLNHHKVIEEFDIKAEQQNVLSVPKQLETLIQGYSFPTIDPKISANRRCDQCIEQLIVNEQRFFTSYPYLIGKHLIEKIEQSTLSEQQILSRLKHITEELSSIDPVDIFQLVGYHLESDKESHDPVKSLIL